MSGRRVIVHAGFHKTATTSVQTFLQSNAKHFWKRCRLILPRHIRHNAARMAARYSRYETPALLDAFADDLHKALAKLDLEDHHKVLISDENLAGRMPGRDGHMTYHATPDIMARAEQVLHDVYGSDTEVIYHFTTRAPDDWLLSAYKHNLRKTRLTMDQTVFFETYRPATNFQDVANAVAKSVTGRVETSDIANLTGPEGPAEPLVDLVDLPPHRRAALEPYGRKNIGPADEMIDALLELNRSNLSDDALIDAKNALLKKDT